MGVIQTNNIADDLYNAYSNGFDDGYKQGQKDSQPQWIPCSERLPEKGGYYLWSAKGGNVEKDCYLRGKWVIAEKYGYEVVAWMPLPEPYKEGEE